MNQTTTNEANNLLEVFETYGLHNQNNLSNWLIKFKNLRLQYPSKYDSESVEKQVIQLSHTIEAILSFYAFNNESFEALSFFPIDKKEPQYIFKWLKMNYSLFENFSFEFTQYLEKYEISEDTNEIVLTIEKGYHSDDINLNPIEATNLSDTFIVTDTNKIRCEFSNLKYTLIFSNLYWEHYGNLNTLMNQQNENNFDPLSLMNNQTEINGIPLETVELLPNTKQEIQKLSSWL